MQVIHTIHRRGAAAKVEQTLPLTFRPDINELLVRNALHALLQQDVTLTPERRTVDSRHQLTGVMQGGAVERGEDRGVRRG